MADTVKRQSINYKPALNMFQHTSTENPQTYVFLHMCSCKR